MLTREESVNMRSKSAIAVSANHAEVSKSLRSASNSGHSTQPGVRLITVVPCYNEAQRLDTVQFNEFAFKHPHLRFLFVNDGSQDQTAAVIDELARESTGQIESFHLPRNQGKGEAVRQGMLHATEQSAQYVAFWDADLSTPLSELESFCSILDSLAELQCVIGSRQRLCGHTIERSLSRELLSKMFALAASFAIGKRFRDTQCGAKLFRNNGMLRQVFSKPFLAAWTFDVEVIARYLDCLSNSSSRPPWQAIYEYPLPTWIDRKGSKRKPGDLVRVAAELLKVFVRYRIFRGGKLLGDQPRSEKC